MPRERDKASGIRLDRDLRIGSIDNYLKAVVPGERQVPVRAVRWHFHGPGYHQHTPPLK